MVAVQPKPSKQLRWAQAVALAIASMLYAPGSGLAQEEPVAPDDQPPPAPGEPPAAEPAPPEAQPPATEPEPPPAEPAPAEPTTPTTEPTAEPTTGPTAEEEDAPDEPRTVVVNVHRQEEEEEEEEEPPPPPSPFDPHENVGDKLYHFGAFVRGIFVPQYGQNFFVHGGNDALRPAGGVFFNFRQDNFNFQIEVWGANFFNQAAYRGINEEEIEMEWIESELNVLFVSLVMMYSIPISSWLALEIGGGIGGGGVFGSLWRTEAYPDPDARAGWTPCAHPNDPNDPVNSGGPEYCDDPLPDGEGGSYQRFFGQPEPYNFSGGVPPLWFWIELPRVALRIKPIRQLQIRAEAGFAFYGVQFGASAAIGF